MPPRSPRPARFRLTLTVEQSAPAYALRLPLEIAFPGRTEMRSIDVAGPRDVVTVDVDARPDGVRLDPDLRVWRVLDREQLPPILRQWIVARAPRLVQASAATDVRDAAAALAARLFEAAPHAVSQDALNRGAEPVLLAGLHDDVDDALARAGLPPRPANLSGRGSAQVWTIAREAGPPVAVVSAADAGALQALAARCRTTARRAGWCSTAGARSTAACGRHPGGSSPCRTTADANAFRRDARHELRSGWRRRDETRTPLHRPPEGRRAPGPGGGGRGGTPSSTGRSLPVGTPDAPDDVNVIPGDDPLRRVNIVLTSITCGVSSARVTTTENTMRIRTMMLASLFLASSATLADETCNSPYMSKLIKGQEDYIHVWTLGVEGWGDGFDKLVTIDANPKSKTYGKVVHSVSVGARGEAHHMGFTDDRRYLWAGGLESNAIHVFDVGADPAKPKLVRTITDLGAKTGYVGPHTFYALPGRMLIAALSNDADKGGATGMAVYNNKGQFVSKYAMPTGDIGGVKGDGYGYDIAVNPAKNALLTSSFTGIANYRRPLGELVADPAAMKNFGSTMVMWDLKAMKPKQIFSVPGSPLEIRWSLKPGDDWAITATALTSKLWLVRPDGKGNWQAKEVGTIGDPAKIPLPVDISIAADGKSLWVNTFMDGTTRHFDLSNPEQPKETYSKVTGKQVNMISQSWDGKRVYITSSLLEKWDKGGADNEQFLRAFSWNGKELVPAFEVDFAKEKLGRAHHMKFSAKSSGSALLDAPAAAAVAGIGGTPLRR